MTIIFQQNPVPVQQNRVFDSERAARECATGALLIQYDAVTNFAFNESFRPELMVYDESYDNSVPSARFLNYYDQIIDHLTRTYGDGGLIVDVGCGKGTFLKRWQARAPHLRGLGIDPSYQGERAIGGVEFVPEYFDASQLPERPSLVLCRHTLEHIPAPTSFLRGVLAALPAGVPVFCEVPDLSWIVANGAWWDFCYEHVNYFTRHSFQRCLQGANVGDARTTLAFEGQYLWAEGRVGSDAAPLEPASDVERVPFAQWTPPSDRVPVIWGMATKGVMMALRWSGAQRFVDNNSAKQGKYAPLSGALIEAPAALRPSTAYCIIVMNPNYSTEIRSQCETLGLDVELVDASGQPI